MLKFLKNYLEYRSQGVFIDNCVSNEFDLEFHKALTWAPIIRPVYERHI